MLLSGRPGDSPSEEELCQLYAGYAAGERWREGGPARLEAPIIWREEEGRVARGDFSGLAGRWYWTGVATCGCQEDKCRRHGGGGHGGHHFNKYEKFEGQQEEPTSTTD